jgi:hypothetical protein
MRAPGEAAPDNPRTPGDGAGPGGARTAQVGVEEKKKTAGKRKTAAKKRKTAGKRKTAEKIKTAEAAMSGEAGPAVGLVMVPEEGRAGAEAADGPGDATRPNNCRSRPISRGRGPREFGRRGGLFFPFDGTICRNDPAAPPPRGWRPRGGAVRPRDPEGVILAAAPRPMVRGRARMASESHRRHGGRSVLSASAVVKKAALWHLVKKAMAGIGGCSEIRRDGGLSPEVAAVVRETRAGAARILGCRPGWTDASPEMIGWFQEVLDLSALLLGITEEEEAAPWHERTNKARLEYLDLALGRLADAAPDDRRSARLARLARNSLLSEASSAGGRPRGEEAAWSLGDGALDRGGSDDAPSPDEADLVWETLVRALGRPARP